MNSALHGLSQADLRALASAFRSGRLTTPFSSLGLQRLLGHHASNGLAEWLNGMAGLGCAPVAMATWLDTFAEEKSSRTLTEEAVQLVTTAPPGSAAVHRDTSVVVQDMFRRAQESVLISTYGIYGGREIFHNLAARMNQNADLQVSIFMNVSQNTRSVEHFCEHHWPQQSRLPKIYYDARSLDNNPVESSVLHSKCLVIDAKEVLVTSANFTEAAQRRNIEVGLLVKSEVLAGQVIRFFESLMNSAHCRQAV